MTAAATLRQSARTTALGLSIRVELEEVLADRDRVLLVGEQLGQDAGFGRVDRDVNLCVSAFA